jgi:hypothetical protein
VTFDDGYRDNLTNALPIAESKGVPITFFVTSGILGNHNGFWWDRLGTLLRGRPPQVREIDLPVGGRNVRLPLGSSGIRADLDSVRSLLLPLRVTEIERALDAVSEQWQVGSAPPPGAGTLTPIHLAAAATSTIVRSTPYARLGSTPRALPSPDRPVPRPIPTASPGAWSWTGDGLGSEFRCNDGNSGERRGPSRACRKG